MDNIGTFNPLCVNLTVTWRIASDLSLKLLLDYTSTTTASYNGSKTEQRQTTSQTGTWKVSLIVECSKSLNLNKIFEQATFRNKYAEKIKDAYTADLELSEAENKLKDPTLSETERNEWLTKKDQALQKVGYANLEQKQLEAKNKYAALLAFDSLSNYYKNEESASQSVIKFAQLYFPIAPTVAFVVNCGAVLDFSISAAFEAQLIINTVNEVTTVTKENSENDYTNSYCEIGGYAGIIGTFNIKIGAQLKVAITIAGIFNLDLTIEGGAYFRLNAMGVIYFGNLDALDISEENREIFSFCTDINNGKCKLYGIKSYDIDMGTYVLAESTIGFDLWILEVTKTFPIASEEWPIIQYTINEGEEYFYDLVFEEETSITTIEEISSQIRTIINQGDSFDPTKTFIFDENNTVITIPNIYIRKINPNTGIISYELVDESKLIYINQDQVYSIGYNIYQNNLQTPAIDNRMNIRIDSPYENIAELYLPIRVIKEPIPVTGLSLSSNNTTSSIGLTESALLEVSVTPINASYQNYEYSIEQIVKPDGTAYSQNLLDQYAYIENNELFTTSEIEIGSKIHIKAQTLPNEFTANIIESNVLVFEITRINISEIIFSDPYQRSDINLGETLSLQVHIYPENATINILQDSTITVSLNDSSLATLEKTDDRNYKLSASDSIENLNKLITLSLSAEDYSKNYTYQIGSVPIQSMNIYNKETGAELNNETELYRLDTLALQTIITPVNASVDAVSYNLHSATPNFGSYIAIDENGILTVSNLAPFGMVVYLSATAMHSTTQSYKITVVRVPVESVIIIADTSYIEQGTVVHFNAIINPDYADAVSIQYELVNPIAGVMISSNMIYASPTVAIGTEIKVKAVVDGIVSNEFSIYVVGDLDTPIIPSEEPPSGEEFIYNTENDIDGDVSDSEETPASGE